MIGLVYVRAMNLFSFCKYIKFSVPNFFRKNTINTKEVVCSKCGKEGCKCDPEKCSCTSSDYGTYNN
mgnify:FL=1